MGISQEAAGAINDDAARRSFVSISQAKRFFDIRLDAVL
jgi:hypothetical protein